MRVSMNTQLIHESGQPAFGLFEQPVDHINYKDCDYRTKMNKRAGNLRRFFNYKQFQYFGGIANDLIFGCAMADIRYLGACFVYVYRPSDKRMLTWQFKTPLAYGLNMSSRTDNGASIFQLGNKQARQIYGRNPNGERSKKLSVRFGNALEIDAEMLEPNSFETKALCTPCAVNGWVYAQKTAALPVMGSIKCKLGEFDLSTLACHGHHDFSAGYMRRETFWNWACFSAPAQAGQPPLGLNISWGVNETGFSENCIWIGEHHHPLPQVQFEYSRDQLMSPWHISSTNKMLNLTFTPDGKHSEEMNAGFLATDFHQIFGKFNGLITLEDGRKIEINNLWGFVEHQFSRW
jgi:hypothetical protein